MRHFNMRAMSDRDVDILLIVLICLIPAVLLRPFQNTPFVDDWVYAWPVEHLLKMQELKILDYSGAINLPQVLWGALFTLPGGFSFTALRISTFVLATASLCALYLVLRELDVSRASARLAVAALAVYPIFFILSFTFMTDVPFIACFIGATLALVIALRKQSTAWLAAAAMFIALSIGMRFVGVAASIAFAMVLLFHAGSWGRRRAWLALIPPAFTVLLIVWQHNHAVSPANMTSVLNSPAYRLEALQYALPLLPKMTLIALGFLSGIVGIALLPLTATMLNRDNVLCAATIFAIMCIGFFLGACANLDYGLPLSRGTWTLDELGAAMSMVPGFVALDAPQWVYWCLGVLGWASTSVLLTGLIRRPSTMEWFLLWSVAFGIGMVVVLWLFHDRYALPLIVPLLVLAAMGAQRKRLLWSAPIVALFAAVSVVGTRDHLSYNAALFSALERVRELGAAASEINGGYVINGWYQYAHPENAPRDRLGTPQIPLVNAHNRLRFELSNSRPPGVKVLATVRYDRWIGRSGELYILDRGRQTAAPEEQGAKGRSG
jgi:hypothetical protein